MISYELPRDSGQLFLAAEVKAQRRIRQMRVIVLRPGTNKHAFVVVVVLIPDIPIKPPVDLYREPGLR